MFEISIPTQAMQRYPEMLCVKAAVLLDEKEQIVACNSAFLEATGYTAAELHMQPAGRFISFHQPIGEVYRNLFSLPEMPDPLPVSEVRTREGESFRSPYLLLKGRREADRFYAVIFKEARKRRSLKLLKQFAGAFLSDVNLGVLLIDANFTLVDISDMACRVLGLDRESVIRKPLDEVFASVPAEHQLVQRTILDGLVVRNHAVSWMNNQERYELLMDSHVLRDEAGTIVGAYVIFKDVTNLRSLEQQVQRSDRLAMIGQIAAGTAHEIRNPLTSIKGFLQVLNSTFQEKQMAKEREFTQIMLMEIDRINDLVNEFLLLSKPKNISLNEVDVAAVFREILPIINNEAILHGVTVHYESSGPLPKIIADRELLKQVYLNICKNGIEAMAEGGHLTISEKVDYAEKKIHIEFHDTGPGIPVFLIDKIFDPFFTTKPNGTGLGLSVVQRIVHDMGGTVRASCKGFGTTFTVSIPFP
jgi:PAS domain S-box-containing protein